MESEYDRLKQEEGLDDEDIYQIHINKLSLFIGLVSGTIINAIMWGGGLVTIARLLGF